MRKKWGNQGGEERGALETRGRGKKETRRGGKMDKKQRRER